VTRSLLDDEQAGPSASGRGPTRAIGDAMARAPGERELELKLGALAVFACTTIRPAHSCTELLRDREDGARCRRSGGSSGVAGVKS